jgi:chemotaxis protein MotB
MSGGGGGGDGGPNPLRWFISYADMITNLMIFFLVLYAMSNVEMDKLLALSDSLKKAFHRTAVESTQVGAALLSDPRRSTKTTAVSEAIEEAVRALGLEAGVSVSADERGTIISLVDSYFFDPGSTVLNSKIKPTLKEVAEFIIETNANVQVEGHTDDVPDTSPPIISNWALSSLRATEVVEFFVANGVSSKHLSAVGYGDTRPLVPNITLENRSRNRRIDIVLTNAVISMKKSKSKEPTTLDIVGDDHDIKERMKIFEAERELGRANDLNKKAKTEGKEEVKEEAKAEH